MVRRSPSGRLLLAASLLVAMGFAIVNCSGTAVLGVDDPLACEPGHECGSAFCRCDDDAVLLSSLCEDEVCQERDDVCARRCREGEHGGLRTASRVETEESPLAAPFCQTICKRMQIGGCEKGCDAFFTGCAADVVCDAELEAHYACLANDAVLSCEAGAVVFSGCVGERIEVCSAAP